jgi:hypothetical protein
MMTPRSLDPLLVALLPVWSVAWQTRGMPRRQKRKRRFLGLKDFQKALPIRLAGGAIPHPIHQGFRFPRTWFDRFETLDEMIHQGLCFFQTGADLFKALDERLSHDRRHPFCRRDNG